MEHRKKLIKSLDATFSKIIRSKGECFCCGTTQNLTCGHLITRALYVTRWDFDNAECQCVACNLRHEYRPEKFTLKYIMEYGIEKYEQLIIKSKSNKKFTNAELLKMLEELKKRGKE